MEMVPDVGRISVSNIRMVVDLPAPFCPRKPYTSPLGTEKERSSTAVTSLKIFVNPFTSIMNDMNAKLREGIEQRNR